MLLLILAVPLVAIAVQAGAGHGEPANLGSWFGLIVGGSLLGAVLLVGVAQSRGPRRGAPLDERASERFHALTSFAAATTAASFALLFATSSIGDGLVVVAIAAAWILLWSPRFMRRIGIRSSVVIDRDPSLVFAFVSDVRNSDRYIPEMLSVDKITDGPIGSGTQFRTRLRVRDGAVDGVEQIVDYEPPTRLTSRLVSGLRPSLEVVTFEPVERGTLLRHQYESELSYSSAVIGGGPARWLLTRQMVRRRNQIWARLKQILESS